MTHSILKITYKPKSKLEKFGLKVHNLLVENFPQTFFVGGMIRDLLLGRKVTDVDITTSATPDEIIQELQKQAIGFIDTNKKFGSIAAKQGNLSVEITTLRTDLPSNGRYPKVKFIKNPKQDSQRRDFTINSLYLRQKDHELLDFQKGLADLQSRQVRFIGNPKKRIQQDPLRIIRGLRFALVLNFKLKAETKLAIKNNFSLTKNLTKGKIEKEVVKIKLPVKQKILREVINNPKYLDKYFK